ncbi:MAG: NAD(P)-dependent oxidoreductase [Alphaproteobacteria bacterium]|nr:NAD(P)-dependent oxidoreductase [Alphaproteobacteria bacterium]
MIGGDAVLVTGATGFLGQAAAQRLAAMGRPVVGMDVVPAAGALPFPLLVADLREPHRLYEAILGHGVGAIVHAGGISGPMIARDHPTRIVETNVDGTLHVFEAARLAKVRRVVWFSSIMAYGDLPDLGPVAEDRPLRPTGLYGATKVAGEAILRAYRAEYGLDGVAFRVASAYGPRRTTSCFVRTLLENARAGRPTPALCDRARLRQYVFVDDVVDAILAALDAERIPELAYNLSSGVAYTTEEAVATVAATVPGVRIEPAAGLPIWGTYAVGPLDVAAARRDLGWSPKVDLAEGARRYAAWMAG